MLLMLRNAAAPRMNPRIGKTIERISAKTALDSFLVIAIMARISAAGPKTIGKNRTETTEKIIARTERVFFCI